MRDPLTGVLDRTGFADALSDWLQVQTDDQALAVLHVDIERLDEIVATHGPEAGDQMLVAVANELTIWMCNAEIVGRLDGDDFVVLLPETNGVEAQRVLSGIDSSINGLAIAAEPAAICASANVGMAIFRGNCATTADQALTDAIAASYDQGRRAMPEAIDEELPADVSVTAEPVNPLPGDVNPFAADFRIAS